MQKNKIMICFVLIFKWKISQAVGIIFLTSKQNKKVNSHYNCWYQVDNTQLIINQQMINHYFSKRFVHFIWYSDPCSNFYLKNFTKV